MLLIVSHSIVLHRVLEHYLKKYFPHITYDKIFNDIDGVKILEEGGTYELILSDWDDDYVDGFKLLTMVRENPETKQVPFVIITEKHDGGSILKCVNASVSGFVKKPVDFDVIDQKIKPFFEKVNVTGSDVVRKQVAIKSLNIPPCPAIVNVLRAELKKQTPALDKIVEYIQKDVALTSSIIKLASSPIYGAGRVESVLRALHILGLDNFANMVLAAILQEAIKDIGVVTETFWRHSLTSAVLCSFIANRKHPKHADIAYLAGLFHDCSIPLFLKRFPGYEKHADLALSNSTDGIALEDKQYSTNHSDVSALVVKTWKVEDVIVEAVRYHHSVDIGTPLNSAHYRDVRELWAILVLAEHISQYYGYSGTMPIKSDEDFFNVYEKAMVELQLDVIDIRDLKEDAGEVLENIADTF
ncbi:MAG: HDOD domain-containing protein [Nitrospirae bacterium]|nr:HDOD domain-containing protein [Nitrospirota bacterium]MBF0534829.1 HDOD domain-containing protein [Nitrospirota bacterium]MBF0616503.1 HDOD domain-containing protein [Nitrospirota bacterium]